jgi:hypothetical protein
MQLAPSHLLQRLLPIFPVFTPHFFANDCFKIQLVWLTPILIRFEPCKSDFEISYPSGTWTAWSSTPHPFAPRLLAFRLITLAAARDQIRSSEMYPVGF